MPPLRRRLRAAAFILYGLAAAGTAALAQDISNTLGPPQLKDFSLPGQRTTPPAATPPAPSPPPPAARPPREAPAATPAAERDRPAPTPRAPAARAPAAGRDAAPAGAPPAEPAASPPVAAAPPVVAIPRPEAPPPATLPPAAAPEPKGGGWLWPAAGGAIVLLLAALLLLRRRRSEAERERARDTARGELGGALLAAPGPEAAPAPAPKPEPEPPAAPRPWLELDIVPERAAATDSEAIVHYALTVTNQGDCEARNIRIDPRLFNAGAEGEMAAFLQGPIHEVSGSPQVVIAPGGTLRLNGEVTMPKAELQEIEMAGRRIFVPMVAINVAYDWEGGAGRTSRSWLVGREAETPQAKMGPFRLDLGPRIYRSVGRREARLVRV
jgi:hypothetical protein